MKIIRLCNGLGNAMFQYANYIRAKKKYPNEEVFLDNIWYDYTGYPYEFDRVFDLDEDIRYIRPFVESKNGISFDEELEKLRFWKKYGFSTYAEMIYENDEITDSLGYLSFVELAELYRPYIEGMRIVSYQNKTMKEFCHEYESGFQYESLGGVKDRVLSHFDSNGLLMNYYRLLRVKNVKEKFFHDLLIGKRPDFVDDGNIDFLNEEGSVYYNVYGYQKALYGIRKEVLDTFKFRTLEEDICADYVKMINDTESVAIFTRSTNWQYGMKALVKRKYFKKAVSYIKRNKGKNICFFVFPDDIDYAKNNIKDLGLDMNADKVIIVDIPSLSDKSYIKMQLGAMCKHCITANTTFGWWAGYLNKNKSKIFVTPYGFISGTISF